MNTRCFRLIFSKPLGFLIPVAEHTRAQRKAGQQSTAPSRLNPLVLSLLLASVPSWSVAEIRLDPRHSVTNVITAPNGVPVIEIADLNRQGLSHNRFTEFDVAQPGVIFNNSLVNGISQLGGAVLRNPNLSRTARAILSEVTGNKPSSISGTLEVFGDKADILIANGEWKTGAPQAHDKVRAQLIKERPDLFEALMPAAWPAAPARASRSFKAPEGSSRVSGTVISKMTAKLQFIQRHTEVINVSKVSEYHWPASPTQADPARASTATSSEREGQQGDWHARYDEAVNYLLAVPAVPETSFTPSRSPPADTFIDTQAPPLISLDADNYAGRATEQPPVDPPMQSPELVITAGEPTFFRPWVKPEPSHTPDSSPTHTDGLLLVKEEVPVLRHRIDNTVPILQGESGEDISLAALRPVQKAFHNASLAELLERMKPTFGTDTKAAIATQAAQSGPGRQLAKRKEIKNAIVERARWLATVSGEERARYIESWMEIEDVPDMGRGVKAARDIPPFTVLAPYAGKLLTGPAIDAEWHKLGMNFANYTFGTKSQNTLISAFGDGVGNMSSLVNKGNDASQNNLTVAMLGSKLIYLMSERPIKAGEPLFYDYGEAYDYRGWPQLPIMVEGSDTSEASSPESEDPQEARPSAANAQSDFDQRVIINTNPRSAVVSQAVQNLANKHPQHSVVITPTAEGGHTIVQGALMVASRTKVEVVGHGAQGADGTTLGGLSGKQIGDLVYKLNAETGAQVDKLTLVGCGTNCAKEGLSLVNEVDDLLQQQGATTQVKGYNAAVVVDEQGRKQAAGPDEAQALGKSDAEEASPPKDVSFQQAALGPIRPKRRWLESAMGEGTAEVADDQKRLIANPQPPAPKVAKPSVRKAGALQQAAPSADALDVPVYLNDGSRDKPRLSESQLGYKQEAQVREAFNTWLLTTPDIFDRENAEAFLMRSAPSVSFAAIRPLYKPIAEALAGKGAYLTALRYYNRPLEVVTRETMGRLIDENGVNRSSVYRWITADKEWRVGTPEVHQRVSRQLAARSPELFQLNDVEVAVLYASSDAKKGGAPARKEFAQKHGKTVADISAAVSPYGVLLKSPTEVPRAISAVGLTGALIVPSSTSKAGEGEEAQHRKKISLEIRENRLAVRDVFDDWASHAADVFDFKDLHRYVAERVPHFREDEVLRTYRPISDAAAGQGAYLAALQFSGIPGGAVTQKAFIRSQGIKGSSLNDWISGGQLWKKGSPKAHQNVRNQLNAKRPDLFRFFVPPSPKVPPQRINKLSASMVLPMRNAGTGDAPYNVILGISRAADNPPGSRVITTGTQPVGLLAAPNEDFASQSAPVVQQQDIARAGEGVVIENACCPADTFIDTSRPPLIALGSDDDSSQDSQAGIDSPTAVPREPAPELIDMGGEHPDFPSAWVKAEPSSPAHELARTPSPIPAEAPVKDEVPVLRHRIDNAVPILQGENGEDITVAAIRPAQKAFREASLAELLERMKPTFGTDTKAAIARQAAQFGAGQQLAKRKEIKSAIVQRARWLATVSGEERARYMESWLEIEDVPGMGRGVKAAKDIPPFTVLAPYAGKVLSGPAIDAEWKKLGMNFANYTFGTKSENTLISAFGDGVGNMSSLVNKGNDASQNNLTVAMLGSKLIYLMSERPIKAGEPLFYDYGEAYDYRGWPQLPIMVEGSDPSDESDSEPAKK